MALTLKDNPQNQPSGQFPRLMRLALVGILALLVSITALPAYLTGQWPWVNPPQVPQIKALQALAQDGLTLPGWTLDTHQVVSINGKHWSINELASPPRDQATDWPPRILVLVYPQPWHTNQPEVEWMDLQSTQHWQINDRRDLTFEAPAAAGASSPSRVTGQIFQATNPQQSFVGLQWYAWPGGGHVSASHWFWVNQRSQWLHKTLTPWIAVSLLVPISPHADMEVDRPLIAALGNLIQQELNRQVFQLSSTGVSQRLNRNQPG